MYAHSYILAKIIMALSAHFPEEVIDQWFENAEIIECTEEKVILHSPSSGNLVNIKEQCYPYILELAKNLLQGNVVLQIWGPHELQQYKQNQKAKPDYLKPQYLFDDFVVGTSNEMAVKTAKAVAAEFGNEAYNPLYIYGPSGAGKTHLLCAIANEIHINRPEANVHYVNADTFVSELIWGLRNGQYDAFRQKYRSVDVLIFDDVQFLEGKASAQEEFYYIFDFLYQNNKLLVFSANRYPSLISGLEHYLYTKFEQGVVIGIDAPDPHVCQVVATRLANSYKLGLNKETILQVVNLLPNNIKEIIAAMKRLRAAHDLNDESLTVDRIKDILTSK